MIEAVRSVFVAQAVVLLEGLDFSVESEELPFCQALLMKEQGSRGNPGTKRQRPHRHNWGHYPTGTDQVVGERLG